MTDRDVEFAFFFIASIIVIFAAAVASRGDDEGPIELFNEITHLVEYIGGPLDGQTGHPWDRSEYLFFRSQCPERAEAGIGAIYRREEGTRAPVKYRFDGYGQKHLLEDCQEV